jgi:hypothetical protein
MSYIDLQARAVLSNIACLIRTEVFSRYHFCGDYGEDLDLAVRLLRQGDKLGFLHSAKVLHSHNRSAFYFLKRGYVDELALARIFPDFVYPEIADRKKLYAEILALQIRSAAMGELLDQQVYPLPHPTLMNLFLSHMSRGGPVNPQPVADEIDCLTKLFLPTSDVSRAQLTMVWPKAASHIADFAAWCSDIYPESDRALAGDMVDAMQKIVALHSGAHLAYLFMSANRKSTDECLQRIDNLLRIGV